MSKLFDTVGGLPVHPLVIHFAVVLVPLAALALIACVANAKIRSRFGAASVLLIAATVPLAFIAKESGESLAERVGITERHQSLGDIFPLWVGALAIAAVSWFLLTRKPGRIALTRVLGSVVIALSVVVTTLTFLVGHSGAEATWAKLLGDGGSASPSSTPTPDASATSAAGITMADVAQHASANDCWTVVDGVVYDMTEFASRHPGGQRAIEQLCGRDGTDAFRSQHGSSPEPNAELTRLVVGPLVTP